MRCGVSILFMLVCHIMLATPSEAFAWSLGFID
jgi:hypothetical protein